MFKDFEDESNAGATNITIPGEIDLSRSTKSTKSYAIDEDSEDGTTETVKCNNSIACTDLPSLALTCVDQATQVENTLAIVLLVGGTASVSVGIPGGAASTNFLNLHFVVPRKLRMPHGVLKEACPGALPIDPRAQCAQKALCDCRSSADTAIKGVCKIRFLMMTQASSATHTKGIKAMTKNPSSLTRVQMLVLDFAKVEEECTKSALSSTLEF